MVWVRATALGYHNGLREIGDEFEIPDDFPVESPWWTAVRGRGADRHEEFQTGHAEVRRGPGRPRAQLQETIEPMHSEREVI